MGDLNKLGGLWPNRSGNGYSGTIKKDKYSQAARDLLASDKPVRVLLFKNTSDHEKSPEYDLLIAADEREGGGYSSPPPDDDTVPF